jgi:hypothetical protein
LIEEEIKEINKNVLIPFSFFQKKRMIKILKEISDIFNNFESITFAEIEKEIKNLNDDYFLNCFSNSEKKKVTNNELNKFELINYYKQKKINHLYDSIFK